MLLILVWYCIIPVNTLNTEVLTVSNDKKLEIVEINPKNEQLDALEILGAITELALTRQIVCADMSVINVSLSINTELTNLTTTVFDVTVPLTKTVKSEKYGYHKEILRITQYENRVAITPLDNALQLPSKAVFKHKLGNKEISITSYFDACYYIALPDWLNDAVDSVKLNLIPVSWLVLVNLLKSLDFAVTDATGKSSLNKRSMLRNYSEIDYVKSLITSVKQLPNNAALKAVLNVFKEDYAELMPGYKPELKPSNTNVETSIDSTIEQPEQPEQQPEQPEQTNEEVQPSTLEKLLNEVETTEEVPSSTVPNQPVTNGRKRNTTK